MKKGQIENIYYRSINKAIDYINQHYSEKITLEMLANEGCFSSWHFHRIFCGIVGETPNEYLKRIRLEKAVMLMDRNHSITEIALSTGFANSSHFSQSFRKQYHISPKQWSKQKVHNFTDQTDYLKKKRFDQEITYTVQNISTFPIAYIRHIGSYDKNIGSVWRTIMSWARKNDLVTDSSIRLSYSWDSPDITPDGKLRYDACISLPFSFNITDSLQNGAPVSFRSIEGGRYVVFPFKGNIDQLTAFYDSVFGDVLPETSFRLGEAPGYRVHFESGAEQALGICRQELWVPLL